MSGTAPLFALFAAGLIIGERVPAQAAVAAFVIVAGVGVLSWNPRALRPGFAGWTLLWPISGAALRGLAQVGAKAGLLLWPSAFAAGLIGYLVSSAAVIGVGRFGRSERSRPAKASIAWFALTGILNGGAVLLMYAALSMAPVSMVAPVVATYPLITALVSVAVLREEALTLRAAAGAFITVAGVIYLVASKTAV